MDVLKGYDKEKHDNWIVHDKYLKSWRWRLRKAVAAWRGKTARCPLCDELEA